MPFTSEDNRSKRYTGNGSTTAFSWPNQLRATGDLNVYLYTVADGVEVAQTEVTHYTIALAADKSSATVNFVTAPTTAYEVVLEYGTALTNAIDHQNYDGTPAEIMNETDDRSATRDLTLQRQLDIAVKSQPSQDFDGTIPNMFGKDGFAIVIADDGDGTFSLNLGTNDAVSGPAAGGSTDNAVVRWDAATGRLLQNSGVIIDDSDNVTGVGTLAAGNTTITGTVTASSTIIASAAATVGTTLGVTGVATFSDNVILETNNAILRLANSGVGNVDLQNTVGTLKATVSATNEKFKLTDGGGDFFTVGSSVTQAVYVSNNMAGANLGKSTNRWGVLYGASVDVTGDIVVGGTVDGRDVATDGTKLDGITGTNTGDEVPATDTVSGIVELATSAEVTTGTDTVRAITPEALTQSSPTVQALTVGADVTTQAVVTLYGGTTDNGGRVEFWAGDSDDTFNQFFAIEAEGSLTFSSELGGEMGEMAYGGEFQWFNNGLFGRAGAFGVTSGAALTAVHMSGGVTDTVLEIRAEGVGEDVPLQFNQKEATSNVQWVIGYDDSENAFAIENSTTFAGSPALKLADTTGNATFAGAIDVASTSTLSGAVTIDAALAGGNLLIDVSSYAGNANVSADHFVIQHNTTPVGMSLLGSAGGNINIFFGEDTAGTGANDANGRIVYSNSANSLALHSNGVTASLTIDSANDATFAGGVDVGGDLTLGASGVNKTRIQHVPLAGVSLAAGGGTTPTRATWTVQANRLVEVIDFVTADTGDVGVCVPLPEDYDGSAITVDMMWSASAGAGDVRWLIQMESFEADQLMNVAYSGSSAINTTMTALTDLHISSLSRTPTSGAGDFLTVKVRRDGTNVADTHSGTARLLGIRLRYT